MGNNYNGTNSTASWRINIDLLQMQKKPQGPIRRCNDEDASTKVKVGANKTKVAANDGKATVSIRDKIQASIASQLLAKSTQISDEESGSFQDSVNDVQEIDPLFIKGFITNLRPLDELTKSKYQLSQPGQVFEVEDYSVILVGRHRIGLKDGFPVGLYAPSYFKSARDPKTGLIEVVVRRKINDELKDPMQYPYIVVDPDNSLYPTYICSWIECKRRISISHYIQFNEPANEPMVLGNAIHRYLQWLIRKEVEPVQPTEVQIRRLYDSFLYEMFLVELDFDFFAAKVENGIFNMVQWYDRHILRGEKIELNKWQRRYLRITRALGSQIMLRSSYFGIRGKVDGLLEGEYIDEKNNLKYLVCVPFELKTGKRVLDTHKRQIDLYTLLVREVYKMPVIGLLYYSEPDIIEYRSQNFLSCFENINVHRNKIMVNLLNLFAQSNVVALPALPQTFDQCRFCDSSIECGVPRAEQLGIRTKDIEDIQEDCPEKYNPDIFNKLKSLSVLEVKYLKKWVQMLHLEECCEKESNLKCKAKNAVNKLKMDLAELSKLTERNPGEPIRLRLRKAICNNEMSESLEDYFKVSDKLRIFIPDIRIADGCRIMSTEKTTKTFTVEIEIKNEEVKFNRGKACFLLEEGCMPALNVEMEKYDNSYYNFTRGYVYKFVKDAPQWMKDIVIEETHVPAPLAQNQDCDSYVKELNEDQAEAFRRCAYMDKFALVGGMPGTGKTKLILKLMEYYYEQGKTVLVTAFTNQALFNILEREVNVEKKIPAEHLVREGSRYGIVEGYESQSSQGQEFHSVDQYKKFFKNKKVWIVTISSLYIQHLPEKFDVVILDEASQCLEPNCLEALVKATKFVLIGDERQLQPVVKSPAACDMGMQVSLFERLCKLYPENISTLKKQYRMNPLIMNLSNNLVYDGKLELASSSLKTRQLDLDPDWKDKTPAFIEKLIDPASPLWFVNQDQALNLYADKGDNCSKVRRFLQICITCTLYKKFRELGVEREKILIISAYNSLVHQLVAKLKSEELIDRNRGDVLTIDRSQGTDKEVILFLFYKGNRELIENPRRLNVALTRAKNKFIIIGSKKQLSELTVWTGQLSRLLDPYQFNLGKDFLQHLLE